MLYTKNAFLTVTADTERLVTYNHTKTKNWDHP